MFCKERVKKKGHVCIGRKATPGLTFGPLFLQFWSGWTIKPFYSHVLMLFLHLSVKNYSLDECFPKV